MRRRTVWITFGLILLLVAGAGALDWPKSLAWKIGQTTKTISLRLGLDLQGGTSLTYQADLSKVKTADQPSAMAGLRDVIERRVNSFGVAEPVVQTLKVGGDNRVVVELAGITDVNQAIQMIGQTPLLEFRELGKPTGLSDADAKAKAQDVLAQLKKPKADFAAIAKQNSDDPGSKDNGGDLGWVRKGQLVSQFETALWTLKDGQMTGAPVQTEYGYHIIERIATRTSNVNGSNVEEIHAAHILIQVLTSPVNQNNFVTTGLSGKQLKRADVVFDPNTGAPQVQLQFNSEGTKLFDEITKRDLNKTVAIYLDGSAISTPTVNSEITNGVAVITGSFSITEAKQLAQRLNEGALPVPINLVSQENIGASLGKESIERSVVAGLLGLAMVAIFMIFYYRLPGLLAVTALLAYSALVLAIFKLWPVTLTLAGIAGYILSIGMAVDANILVFERTKEELRDGHPLLSAIDAGFRRAWLSIRDSNVSSLITCLILVWFGTSVVKGFAVTLAIGILVSMFSALTITRTLMHVVVSRWMGRHSWLFGVSHREIHSEDHV